MKVAVKFTKKEEEKAVPILFRHSAGMMLPGDIYLVSESAIEALRKGGVRFTEVSREAATPELAGAGTGERI